MLIASITHDVVSTAKDVHDDRTIDLHAMALAFLDPGPAILGALGPTFPIQPDVINYKYKTNVSRGVY